MREWIYLHVGSNLPQYFRMGILLCVIWTIQSLMYFTNEVLLRKCTPRNLGFPGGSVIRIHLPMQDIQETWAQSLLRKTPWKREWQPIPVLLPGKSHRQKSLGGYSPGNCRVRHDWACTSRNLSSTSLLCPLFYWNTPRNDIITVN